MKVSFWQKIRDIEFKKRYVVIAVIIAVIIRFWGESSVTLLQKEVPLITNTQISAEEILSYIQTKQELIAENMVIEEEVLAASEPEKFLNKNIHKWFLIRNWHPNRFFYVEQRLKLILQYIYERQNKLDEADRLEEISKQLLISTPPNTDIINSSVAAAAEAEKQAQDIRYYIDKEIRSAGISPTEDDTVIENLAVIEELLGK